MPSQPQTSRREHDTPRRVRFKALVQSGTNQRDAAAQVGVSRSTAQRWLKDPDRRTKRQGRKPILTDEDIQKITELFDGSWTNRVKDAKAILSIAGFDCSVRTVQRALKRAGYLQRVPYLSPFISRTNKAKRLKFAQEYSRKTKAFWRKGIYTDESSFSTRTFRRQRVWRKDGERFRPDTIQWTFNSGRDSIMMWAAIGYNFKGPLHIMSKTSGSRGINAEAYRIQILEGHLAELAAEHEGTFFVEDNAPIHGKKDKKTTKSSCNEARCQYHIHSIDWPPSSPDLNPIEWIWRWMKQRLRSRRPQGGWAIASLKQAIYEVWDELQLSDYQKIIDSMPERLREVREREGGQTRY